MFVDKHGEVEVSSHIHLLAVFLNMGNGLLYVIAKGTLVDFQGFLFYTFCGERPIPLWRHLHRIDIRILATAYPYFFVIGYALFRWQGIHREYLLPLYIGQAENGRYVAIAVFELALVEQYLYIRVVDDGFFHDGRVYHVVQFLRHHTGYAVELADCLIQIFDVPCHGRRGNSLPCFLYDECLAPLFQTHLLQEHVHDDQHNNREENRVILDFVNLKDDKFLIEERFVEVVVQRVFQLASLVELLQDGRKVINVKLYLLLGHDLRYALQGKLIITVERQIINMQFFTLLLYLIYLLFYAHQILALDEFGHQPYQLLIGIVLFTLRGSLVIDDIAQLANLPLHPCMVVFLLLGKLQILVSPIVVIRGIGFTALRRFFSLQCVDGVVVAILLFQFLLVPVILAVFLVFEHQAFTELFPVFLRELLKGVEVLVIVLHKNLVDNLVLNLGWFFIALEDKEDERFEELLLLTEVQVVLIWGDAEWVHGDWLLLAVGNIGAMKIMAYSLVAVAGVDHNNIGILHQKLGYDGIHVEAYLYLLTH